MTDQMTPDEARDLLDGTTPGPWVRRRDADGNPTPVVVSAGPTDRHHIMTAEPAASPERQHADTALIAAAPALAAMIAGMRAEYAVQVLRSGEWQYSRGEDDFRWQDLAVQMVREDRDHPGEETRLVRRYVTEPEEA